MIALAINSGSSSLKFGLYDVRDGRTALLCGGTTETVDDHGLALDQVASTLDGQNLPAPSVIGHRIVHGGPKRDHHCLIDDAVEADLRAACAFSPLHGPASLALIAATRIRYPGVAQAACFDTAFHVTMPDVARELPIPSAYREGGIRRYGFHGLSCESIVRQLGDDLPAKLVIAHLGNGASITAVRDGRSIDTSMGLTPSGGVVMGTRSGDLDPGVLFHLLREKAVAADALASLIDHQSGMLGISGLSGDMRRLRAAASSDPRADLAIRMFERSVCKQIAAMIAALEGADLVILTGGIGEHDPLTGRSIRDGLGWLPNLPVRTMPSLEDEQIAWYAADLAGPAA